MNTKDTVFYRRFVLFFLLFILPVSSVRSQICYSPLIDSVISRVSLPSVVRIVKELCGDTVVTIGGNQYTLRNRSYNQPENQLAAQYIYEKFQSYGLQASYWQFSTTGKNVFGKKPGYLSNNKYFILGAHFDSYPFAPIAPGADDNATGTAGVIEAARILSSYNLAYGVLFVAWDEEERGLYGSRAFADTAFAHGDSIIAVINLDMLAYNVGSNNMSIVSNSLASGFANSCKDLIGMYNIGLNPSIAYATSTGSDVSSFWQKGYKGIWPFEDYSNNNPHINSTADSMYWFNYPYFLKMSKVVAALTASFGLDFFMNFSHNPVYHTNDTTDVTLSISVKSSYRLASGSNSPKLYYKAGNEPSFTMVNHFYNNLDTFKFKIPGKPYGTHVTYYFAAQDSAGTIVGTYPGGGRGFNPPGTQPPTRFLEYYVTRALSQCSNNLPKNIPPGQTLFDTIYVTQPGKIFDVNVNTTIYHTNDADLTIMLVRPGAGQITLSSANGGSGDNYINTTFDDEAAIPITQGTPPFTGSFRPQSSLSVCDSAFMNIPWILKIYNSSSSVTGSLENWCLNITYAEPISVANNQIPVRSGLSQNYPNPFNSSTVISFSVQRKSHIRIAVFDLLGRETTVLVNDEFSGGDYNVKLNANSYASGMYFYSLYIDGVLFQTRKMVILK